MPFYQNSVINKYINTLDKKVVSASYEKFKGYFHNPVIQKNIRDAKEEQFQEGFLRELFVNILGYTINPNPDYNLTTEYKNENGAKKADGAILKDGKAIAVIELKGTDTKDLDKINEQAFNYKNNQGECIYVITSNFEKIRFFIHNSVEHLEFNLFTLTEAEFELLWLCLCVECLPGGIPLKAKEESLSIEENITKHLYIDYSNFKNDLWQNLVKNNPDADPLMLYKKSQKLLDRFLFILFTEDSGLLPPNSISRIVDRWKILKEEDAYKPLYEIFKQFFGYIYTGRKGKTPQDDIYAFNGGLFNTDDLLDNFVIGDEILEKHVMKLTAYDFQSDVDVNILGHIFEHSLNEIENVTARLQGQEIEKSKTKRKKEGVYYTPKYITKYIVENTVGKLCQEKRDELGIVDEEYAKGRRHRQHDIIRKLDNSLQAYRNWLLNITICDPACGSGAFLNQALEYLIEEHAFVDELHAQLHGATIVFQDVGNHILEKNLYGVDINEESIEIAKLSLWLRTAQRGRKLSSLNNNLKCGNSLIDDPEVAGDKAFKWEEEFPEVFANGGFDVVIGNPPYIKEATNRNAFDGLHDNACYQGKMDLWYFFGAIALEITKIDKGTIGFIAPNNWVTNDGASKFRNIVLENGKLIEFVDFGDFKVFDSAGIQTMIYIMQRTKNNHQYSFNYSKVKDKRMNHLDAQIFLEKGKDNKFEYYLTSINKDDNYNKQINFIDDKLNILIDKIASHKNFSLLDKEIGSGIDLLQDFVSKSHLSKLENVQLGDGIFNLSHKEYLSLNLSEKEKKIVKPFYTTQELKRYYGNKKNKYWIIYTTSEFKNPEKIKPYPKIKKHLDKFLNVLTSVNKPYGLHRSRDENYFKGEKILSLRKCSNRPSFTFSDFDTYVNRTFLVIKSDRIDLKYLTGLLNSNLFVFWLKLKGKMQGYNFQVDKTPLINLPLVNPDKDIQQKIAESVENIINCFQKETDYLGLLEDVKNENNFEREIYLKKELVHLAQVIKNTESKINQMVYELYGLTDEEIGIVEEG